MRFNTVEPMTGPKDTLGVNVKRTAGGAADRTGGFFVFLAFHEGVQDGKDKIPLFLFH